MMKRILFVALALCLFGTARAQSQPQVKFPDYQFTTVKANPITPIIS